MEGGGQQEDGGDGGAMNGIKEEGADDADLCERVCAKGYYREESKTTTTTQQEALLPSAENDSQHLLHRQGCTASRSTDEERTGVVVPSSSTLPQGDTGDNDGGQQENEICLKVTWGSERVDLTFSSTDFETFSVLDLRRKIDNVLDIPETRQRYLGIAPPRGAKRQLLDSDMLASLTFKKPKSFVLIGSTRERQFIDPSQKSDLPEVIDDFDYDPTVSAEQEIRNPLHLDRLHRAAKKADIRLIRAPRPLKKLLVLDLDYTLLDCKGTSGSSGIKRPYVDRFLALVSKSFDLAVWSQTQWKWVEMKCTELGLLTSSTLGLCFALDRTSMFTVSARQRDGSFRSHEVKALEIIWNKFPDRWGPHNTIHVDDLARNFAFNPRNGVRIASYRKERNPQDSELLFLAQYLSWLATVPDVSAVDHSSWRKRVAQGKLPPPATPLVTPAASSNGGAPPSPSTENDDGDTAGGRHGGEDGGALS